MSSELSDSIKAWMQANQDLSYHFAGQIIANYPSPRYQAYEHSNFDQIKDDIIGYLYPIMNGLGLYDLGTNLALLESMEIFSYAVMFIGLIINVLLLIFTVVSCLLIYSLLLISVENKTFDIGVMRLIGLTKYGFIGLVLT